MASTTIPTRAGKLRTARSTRYVIVADYFSNYAGKYFSMVERGTSDLGKAKNLCVASSNTYVYDMVDHKVVYVPGPRTDLIAFLDSHGLLAPGAVR